MNNDIYMSIIEERFYVLQHRILIRSELNVLNLNLRSENFYREVFNKIYGYNLVNANTREQNATSIDLIDTSKKIVLQITSTVSKRKIETTLSKSVFQDKYAGYKLYFMFIGNKADKLKTKIYNNPYNVPFDPNLDIYDVDIILKKINSLDIDKMKAVYDIVEKYLKFPEIKQKRVNSLLPKVITLLCSYDSYEPLTSLNDKKSFEIAEKIRFNHLVSSEYIINESALYEHLINKIYGEFDQSGKLKSQSILMKINRIYQKLKEEISEGDELFFAIIRTLKDEMENEEELIKSGISIEELEMCVEIIVVDAFIRCKIFKKPE